MKRLTKFTTALTGFAMLLSACTTPLLSVSAADDAASSTIGWQFTLENLVAPERTDSFPQLLWTEYDVAIESTKYTDYLIIYGIPNEPNQGSWQDSLVFNEEMFYVEPVEETYLIENDTLRCGQMFYFKPYSDYYDIILRNKELKIVCFTKEELPYWATSVTDACDYLSFDITPYNWAPMDVTRTTEPPWTTLPAYTTTAGTTEPWIEGSTIYSTTVVPTTTTTTAPVEQPVEIELEIPVGESYDYILTYPYDEEAGQFCTDETVDVWREYFDRPPADVDNIGLTYDADGMPYYLLRFYATRIGDTYFNVGSKSFGYFKIVIHCLKSDAAMATNTGTTAPPFQTTGTSYAHTDVVLLPVDAEYNYLLTFPYDEEREEIMTQITPCVTAYDANCIDYEYGGVIYRDRTPYYCLKIRTIATGESDFIFEYGANGKNLHSLHIHCVTRQQYDDSMGDITSLPGLTTNQSEWEITTTTTEWVPSEVIYDFVPKNLDYIFDGTHNHVAVKPGETITINWMVKNDPGTAGMEYSLSFEPCIYLSEKIGKAYGCFPTYNADDLNDIRFVMASPVASIGREDRPILSVTVEVPYTCGSYEVGFTGIKALTVPLDQDQTIPVIYHNLMVDVTDDGEPIASTSGGAISSITSTSTATSPAYTTRETGTDNDEQGEATTTAETAWTSGTVPAISTVSACTYAGGRDLSVTRTLTLTYDATEEYIEVYAVYGKVDIAFEEVETEDGTILVATVTANGTGEEVLEFTQNGKRYAYELYLGEEDGTVTQTEPVLVDPAISMSVDIIVTTTTAATTTTTAATTTATADETTYTVLKPDDTTTTTTTGEAETGGGADTTLPQTGFSLWYQALLYGAALLFCFGFGCCLTGFFPRKKDEQF